MDYSNYTIKDFTMDETFQQWALHPDDTSMRVFWESWIAKNPEKRETVEQAKNLVRQFQFNTYVLPEAEVTQIWENINTPQTATRFSGIRNTYWKVAAVVALLLVAAIFVINTFRYSTYQTAYGETKTIHLPDQSIVRLNANSTLRLISTWKADSPREVWLDGEAYFSVVHTQNHQKFIVHTEDKLNVEVLGTEFNVSKRKSGTKVVLNSGKVKLNLPKSGNENNIIMRPGELVEFKDNHYSKKIVDPAMYSAWTQNKMILNRTSLHEIKQLLEDNYGLEIKVTDPALLEQTVSGSMPLGDIDKLLLQISKTFRLKVTRVKNQVSIAENPM